MRVHRRPQYWIFTSALTLTLGSGCSLLNVVAGPSKADLDEAYEGQDLAYLQELCAKGRERATRDVMRGEATDQEERACSLASELTAQMRGEEEAAELAAFRAALTCENPVESLASFGAQEPDEHDYAKAFDSAGLKLAECGDDEGLVTALLPLARIEGLAPPESMGQQILAQITETDASFPARIAAAAKGNTFSFESSWIAAGAITAWLIEASVFDNCSSYVAALDSPHVGTIKEFIRYHGRAKCKAAAAGVAAYLASENDSVRWGACEALGRIGDPAYLDKLAVVAESDAAYETDGLVKTYYVRDACLEAAGKVKLAQ